MRARMMDDGWTGVAAGEGKGVLEKEERSIAEGRAD